MTDITNTAGNDLKNYAYNILKERLINCTYAPGSILNEAHLTSEMKLSRTLCVKLSAVWRQRDL